MRAANALPGPDDRFSLSNNVLPAHYFLAFLITIPVGYVHEACFYSQTEG